VLLQPPIAQASIDPFGRLLSAQLLELGVAAEVEERATEMIRVFRERGLPFIWSIGPNTDAPQPPVSVPLTGSGAPAG